MRTRQTRRTVVGSGIGGLGVLVAACGGSSGGGGSAGGQFKEAVTVEFAHRWEGVREPLIAQQIESFAKVQPNIKINAQQLYCPTTSESCIGGMDYGKITAQIAGGTPPDLFMVQSPYGADYAARGALKNLNDLAKRDKIDLPKTFYPALVTMSTFKGNVIGFPQLSAGDTPYLFMSNAVWQQAGANPNNPPASWEELIATGQKLTKRGGGPGGFDQLGFDLPNSFLLWAPKNNAKILSDDASKVLFNSQEGIDALQWMFNASQQLYGKWADRGAFMTASAGQGTGGSRAPWYTNKVGMWNSGVWHFFEIKGEKEIHNPSFQYSAALVPHNVKNSQAKQVSQADVVWLYSLPAGTKKADAAFEWLKYITAGEGNRIFVKAQNRPSPAPKINDDPDFSKDIPLWNTVIKKALEIMVPLPQTPAWGKISTAISKMTTDVLNGAKAPRDAMADAAREAQLAIDELKR